MRNDTNIEDTACFQYDKDKIPKISCVSWYDYQSNEVVCICKKQGLTTNIFDKVLSNASKLSQFPNITLSLSIKIYFIFFS